MVFVIEIFNMIWNTMGFCLIVSNWKFHKRTLFVKGVVVVVTCFGKSYVYSVYTMLTVERNMDC